MQKKQKRTMTSAMCAKNLGSSLGSIGHRTTDAWLFRCSNHQGKEIFSQFFSFFLTLAPASLGILLFSIVVLFNVSITVTPKWQKKVSRRRATAWTMPKPNHRQALVMMATEWNAKNFVRHAQWMAAATATAAMALVQKMATTTVHMTSTTIGK